MAQVYMPQSQDLIGLVTQIQGYKDNKKKLDLLGKEYASREKQVQAEEKTQKIKQYLSSISIPGLPLKEKEFFANQISKELGGPSVVLGDRDKEFITRAEGLLDAYQNGKNITGPLSGFINDFADRKESLALIKEEMSSIKGQQEAKAGEFLDLLGQSGGTAYGREQELLGAFAGAGGTEFIRSAAQKRITDYDKDISDLDITGYSE